MNERIKELKRQAMMFAQEKCDGQTTDMHGNLRSDIWTEKFAELLRVDMFLNVVSSILITDIVMEEKGQKPTSNDYIQAINRDFGIEE